MKVFLYFLIEKPVLSIAQLKTRHAAHSDSENLCGIILLRVISETVSVYFDIFDKSLSFSRQKTHSTGAKVSVDDLCLALLCSTF